MERLTLDEIVTLRMGLELVVEHVKSPEIKHSARELMRKLEFGCGVTVVGCDEESERLIDESLAGCCDFPVEVGKENAL